MVVVIVFDGGGMEDEFCVDIAFHLAFTIFCIKNDWFKDKLVAVVLKRCVERLVGFVVADEEKGF